jgi:hypothetical protein
MTSFRAASPLLFTTAGTLGPVGTWGWLLGELPEPIKVRGDESVIRKYVLGCAGPPDRRSYVLPERFLNRVLLKKLVIAVLVAAAEVVILSAGRRKR